MLFEFIYKHLQHLNITRHLQTQKMQKFFCVGGHTCVGARNLLPLKEFTSYLPMVKNEQGHQGIETYLRIAQNLWTIPYSHTCNVCAFVPGS